MVYDMSLLRAVQLAAKLFTKCIKFELLKSVQLTAKVFTKGIKFELLKSVQLTAKLFTDFAKLWVVVTHCQCINRDFSQGVMWWRQWLLTMESLHLADFAGHSLWSKTTIASFRAELSLWIEISFPLTCSAGYYQWFETTIVSLEEDFNSPK